MNANAILQLIHECNKVRDRFWIAHFKGCPGEVSTFTSKLVGWNVQRPDPVEGQPDEGQRTVCVTFPPDDDETLAQAASEAKVICVKP